MAVQETPTAAAAAANKAPPAVEIIASVVPWADKEERLLSLFRSIAAHAQKHEPDCTRYLIYVHPSTSPSSPGRGDLENQDTSVRGSKIEIVERYSAPGALEEHTRSEPFRALVQALGEEELLSEDPGTIEEGMVRCVAGFE
ncbi:MAG: hypothetical protein Q9210_004287 [Variospora velana]